ncbi:CinA family protein [Piscinibacter sakaiensis]|uniref:CinA family protein n=1 Tax=Piscinibacter sakaiensis TaxID=1547922 RepID=UPI003AB00320
MLPWRHTPVYPPLAPASDHADVRANRWRALFGPGRCTTAGPPSAKAFRASWGLAETGATGPTGNSHGDPAGHTCLAVDGPALRQRTPRAGQDNLPDNLLAFAMGALELLEEAIDAIACHA